MFRRFECVGLRRRVLVWSSLSNVGMVGTAVRRREELASVWAFDDGSRLWEMDGREIYEGLGLRTKRSEGEDTRASE
jgi:hypothetical protein